MPSGPRSFIDVLVSNPYVTSKTRARIWQLFWSFAVAGMFVGWVLVPAARSLSLPIWRAVGVALVVFVGFGAASTTRSALRGAGALVVGLLAAAVWLDVLVPDDTRGTRPTISGVLHMLYVQHIEFALALAGAMLGVAAAHAASVSWRKRECD